MQKLILYIQPQLRNTTTQDFVRVDLMEEELISLTQVIQDVNDIEKIFTDFSRTFNLPASKANNKIFKHWHNPDIDGFDNQIFCNARIELNHLHFRFGKIQLNEAVMKFGEPSIYKVTFFGNTTTFKNAINEDELSNLVWLNEFNHSATATNVKDGLENGLNFTVDSVAYNNAIIYPLVAHSQSYVYDNTNNDSNGLNISYTNNQNRTQRGVVTEDLKPAILVKNIIKAIEEQYNITFKTGEFLDSNAMNDLYLWLHREKGKMATAGTWIGNSDFYTCSGNCSELTNTSSVWGYFTLNTGIFLWKKFVLPVVTITKDITSITLEVTPATGFTAVKYSLEIVRANNWESFAKIENQSGTSSITLEIGTANGLDVNTLFAYSIFGTNWVGRLISESSINFQAKFIINREVEYIRADGVLVNFNNTATFTSSSTTLSPQDKLIVITEQMPKLKIKDFLNGLFRAFNLTAYVDFFGQIIVKNLNDYYNEGETFDITQYVKTTEHNVCDVIPFSEVDFEYSEPKSILAEQFQLLNNQKYGELNYATDVSEKNIYQIKIPFEHMLFERLQDKTSGTLSTAQVGSFLNTELNPSIGQPLLFYGVYQENQDSINFLDSTRPETYSALCPTGTNSSLDDYWIPSACNELGTSSTPPTYNLNFGSEINTYTLTDYGGNNNSLFQKYYENYITRIFNKKTRIFKFSAILPLKVLLNLTLDDTVIVGTRAYTINKMSTKLQSGETNFELFNEPFYESVADNTSVSYSSAFYCTNQSNPSPTVTPSGGTFTAS